MSKHVGPVEESPFVLLRVEQASFLKTESCAVQVPPTGALHAHDVHSRVSENPP